VQVLRIKALIPGTILAEIATRGRFAEPPVWIFQIERIARGAAFSEENQHRATPQAFAIAPFLFSQIAPGLLHWPAVREETHS